MKKNHLENIINAIGKLKDLKRSGWLARHVELPESDADHSFGVAFLVMMLAPGDVDKLKCLEMALVHDLAEIYTGDYTPHDKISKADKCRLEKDASIRIANELCWDKLIDLVAEYNKGETRESRFVKLLDKLETLMSAKYYDDNKRAPETLLSEFGESAKVYAKKYNDPDLAEVRDIINSF